MKVPTYKKQLQRTDRTGAGMLTAQVNPNVMALAGQGLEQAGQQLFSFGADMLEVETKKQQLAIKSESSIAVQDLNASLKNITLQAETELNPYKAQSFYIEESEKAYARIINSLSEGAKSLFSINGEKLKTDLNFDFQSKNNAKMPDFSKGLYKNDIDLVINNAANTNNSLAQRMNSVHQVVGGLYKDTTNFPFAEPSKNNVGYSRGGNFTEKDNNIINYHRLNITNNTTLENADKSITTVYIRGIRNPAEGKNSPIYAVPGYYNGKKYSKEEDEQELQEIAAEEGWFDVYPSDPDAKSHKKRVNKLHKIIDKDGETLSKIEKTFKPGLNYEMFEQGIINTTEFKLGQIESLASIAENTLKSIMSSASDANDVVFDLMEGNINDPILNLAWQNLPIEKKAEIEKNARKEAEDIEKYKANAIKKTNDEIEADQKLFYKKMINETSYEEALIRFNDLVEMNFFDTPAQIEAAEKYINKKKGGDDENWNYRTPTERSVPSTIRALATLDSRNELSLLVIDAYAEDLTQADYERYIGKLATEKNEGVESALTKFKNRFGFQDETDVDDRLAKVINAAFFDASDKINDYVEENPEATYQQILEKRNQILNESNEIFVNELQLQRIDDVQLYQQQVDGWNPGDNLTNQEILDLINKRRWVTKPAMSDATYRNIKANFLFYQLKEIDYTQ